MNLESFVKRGAAAQAAVNQILSGRPGAGSAPSSDATYETAGTGSTAFLVMREFSHNLVMYLTRSGQWTTSCEDAHRFPRRRLAEQALGDQFGRVVTCSATHPEGLP